MEQPQTPWQQPEFAPPSSNSGKFALQYGLICGGIVGIIDVIYAYLLDNNTITWFNPLYASLANLPYVPYYIISSIVISIPIYVLLLVAFLGAGILAARKSHQTSSGLLAGLFVGGVFLLIDVLIATILLVILVVFPEIAKGPPPATGAELASLESQAMISGIVYSIVADLLLLGIGAGIGALGGLIGKGPAPAQTQPYAFVPPNLYQPQPPLYANPYGQPAQPGQPVQPGQPAQPGQFPPYPPVG